MDENEERPHYENAISDPRRSKRAPNDVPYIPSKKQVVDDAYLGKVMTFVMKNRPRNLTKEEKLDVKKYITSFRLISINRQFSSIQGRFKAKIEKRVITFEQELQELQTMLCFTCND